MLGRALIHSDELIDDGEFAVAFRTELRILEDASERVLGRFARLFDEAQELTRRWERLHEALHDRIRGREEQAARSRPAVPQPPPLPRRPPIWARARDILAERGQPMSAVELLHEFHQRGWVLLSVNAREVMRNMLVRKPDVFRKLPDGRFELRADVLGARREVGSDNGHDDRLTK